MPPRSPILIALTTATVIGCGSMNPDQTAAMDAAQILQQTQDELYTLRNESAMFQSQMDSLKREVFVTDSLLRALYNLQGHPLPPRTAYYPPPSP